MLRDFSNSAAVRVQFPAAQNPRHADQLTQLAWLASKIAQMPLVDYSVFSMLSKWLAHGDAATARIFQEAAGYIETRLKLMSNWELDDPDAVRAIRRSVRTARRLARALTRIADQAEEATWGAKPGK
jgi:hypothetical protein